jgi:hypothetical protein
MLELNCHLINLTYSLQTEYVILILNEHDIKLRSRLTGHEWIIVSPYDGSSCEILHRHSDRDSFHHQKGQHSCLSKALDYIRSHDCWYSKKERLSASSPSQKAAKRQLHSAEAAKNQISSFS